MNKSPIRFTCTGSGRNLEVFCDYNYEGPHITGGSEVKTTKELQISCSSRVNGFCTQMEYNDKDKYVASENYGQECPNNQQARKGGFAGNQIGSSVHDALPGIFPISFK